MKVWWSRKCCDCCCTEAYSWRTWTAATVHELTNFKNIDTKILLASAASHYPAARGHKAGKQEGKTNRAIRCDTRCELPQLTSFLMLVTAWFTSWWLFARVLQSGLSQQHPGCSATARGWSRCHHPDGKRRPERSSAPTGPSAHCLFCICCCRCWVLSSCPPCPCWCCCHTCCSCNG